jgi:methylenetetrahydrofolate reductase (NADPH)
MIYERADETGRLERLLEIQAPLDWSHVGGETWGTVLSQARARGLLSPKRLFRNIGWGEQVDQMLQDIRQPAWWQGDDLHHPSASGEPVSSLQATLERGEFVVTAEVTPPPGSSSVIVNEKARQLHGLVQAANVTQNPMATPRMSSLACSLLLACAGVEPVVQITARDTNRFALQSQVLGAATLGIRNYLCLTGDPPTAGHKPVSGLPFDLDATQMLWILRRMRDEQRFLDGREIEFPPQLFLGAAGSPSDPKLAYEALRLEKKINAGAQFFQTQLVYDIDALYRWLEALDRRDLLGKAHILVGIGPLRSVKVASYIRKHIPDIVIPQTTINALENSPDPKETGFELALELIRKVSVIPAVGGVHIMSVGWEKVLPRLLREAKRVLDLNPSVNT